MSRCLPSPTDPKMLLFKSFCTSQFPHKSANLAFMITNIKNKLTNLCGNRLLQNNFTNSFCEIRLDSQPGRGGASHLPILPRRDEICILLPNNQRQHRTVHAQKSVLPYRGTPLIRKLTAPGPYRRPIPRVSGRSQGGGCFLMGEVPLCALCYPPLRESQCGRCTEERSILPAFVPITDPFDTVELIPTLGALPPPRRARPGPGPHMPRVPG